MGTFTSTQEFLGGKANYDFPSLVENLLHKKLEIIHVSLIPKFWKNTKDIIYTINNCKLIASLILELVIKIEVLPLTLQLSCTCGSIWQDSLFSQKATRNEYLLLHKFFKEGYIVPESYNNSRRKTSESLEGYLNYKSQVKKKNKYFGGLVFEPVVGLHNQFTLLLDFKSLYPSIIQEYTLCFTTVPHWKGSLDDLQVDQIFELHPYENENAVLPEIISFLLTERIVAKNLLASSNNPLLKKKY